MLEAILAVVDNVMLIELARQEAALALEHGDVPVGAVIELDGEIIARRHNERELLQDPTAHAEVLAIRDAAQVVGSWRLPQARLAVTLEPCLMCAGTMLSARIPHLIFGAYDPKGGACGTLYTVCDDARLNHKIATIGGVQEEACAKLLRDFFANLRSQR